MNTNSGSGPKTVNRFLLLRLVYYILAFVVSSVLARLASTLLVTFAPQIPHDYVALFRNGLLILLALASYGLVVRRVEKRPATEVDPRTAIPRFAGGALLGMSLIALVFAALWAFGLARFGAGSGGPDGLLRAVALPTVVALLEELLFRVVLFGMLEQIAGTMVAVIVSAALFGLAHAANPGVNAFDIGALMAGLGVLLALAYAWSRNIGLPAGIHMGWNFAQASLFGAKVSGLDQPFSLVKAELAGPDLLTGGTFGVEGSVIALGLCIAVSLGLFALIARHRRWRSLAFRLRA